MSTSTQPKNKVILIDSHLHVWASSKDAAARKRFPYSQDPPDALQNVASIDQLVATLNENGVHGALLVQPINYKFDHSYVLHAMKTNPTRFKGMLLHDPSLAEHDAVDRLEDLALQGFVGVRFNPYLWPKAAADDGGGWSPMSEQGGGGLAVYKRCGQLNIPVGIMCFQGLRLHYDDILQLLKASPTTVMVLDHFGFTTIQNDNSDDVVFQKLLDLAQYPQVMVKISALFRLGDDASPLYERVRTERFLPLLQAFGADRLMYGSDFPYVLEQPPEKNYGGMMDLVSSWIQKEQDKKMIMGGTAEKAFGPWGYNPAVVS
jgi:predicted TIM-barrel fold metal-dependent hydrolase